MPLAGLFGFAFIAHSFDVSTEASEYMSLGGFGFGCVSGIACYYLCDRLVRSRPDDDSLKILCTLILPTAVLVALVLVPVSVGYLLGDPFRSL